MSKIFRRFKSMLRLNSLTSLCILFVLIIFTVVVIMYNNIINESKSLNENTIREFNQKDSDYLFAEKEKLDQQIYNQLLDISQVIEEDINNNFDMEELEEQLNNGIIPIGLDNLFSSHIRNKNLLGVSDQFARILICNSSGVISDFSLSRATINDDRTWEYEISKQYNKEMATKTIENILNQDTDSILVFEPYFLTNEYKKYTEIDEGSFKEIYMNGGLEALKSYYFLVPVYITKDGDIFGKNDVVLGHKKETNKFIIIQEYNLYDYIMKNNIDKKLFDKEKFSAEASTKESIMYIFGIILAFFAIFIVILLSALANMIHDKNIILCSSNKSLIDIDLEHIKKMAKDQSEGR